MDKIQMREYVASLELRISKALDKWKKTSHIENGEVVQVQWQFEQSHVSIDVFWHDWDEHINLECRCPRMRSTHEWRLLNDQTATNVMDRIGNFAQVVQWKRHEDGDE